MLGATASIALLAPCAFGAVTVTNGDFETGGGDNIDNVTSWSDPSNGTFWQGSWQTNAGFITPNGTNVIVLGSYESGAVQNTASADANAGNYLYQSIGTAEGAPTISVQFDWGAPNDDPGGRQLGLTVGIYAYDGLGGFTPGDNTDVRGAGGITFLGSQSFTLTSTGVDGLIGTALASIDVSGAGSQELFLRFNNYRPGNTESWTVLDNVSAMAVPEPSVALLGGLGLLGLLRRRRA